MLCALVLIAATVHVRRPSTLCLLRSTTGVPCPFCGGTTATVRLGHGDVGGALGASPLAVLMLAGWPLLPVVRTPGWWASRRVRRAVILLILVGAEIWQLGRFGLLGG
jgi:hypothetical protein